MAILKRTDFFAELPANYLASLAAVAHPRSFYKGETLLHDGQVADALYVLCEGRVGIMMGGREVWQAAPPNCLGDISLIDGEVEPVTAVALEDVRTLRVSALDSTTSSRPNLRSRKRCSGSSPAACATWRGLRASKPPRQDRCPAEPPWFVVGPGGR